jgi:sec-independent protein translocase protein TatC
VALDQQGVTAAEMPFLDHLEELRWRIVKSLLALIVAFAVAFWICSNYDVFAILAEPIKPYLHGKKLIYTHPMDPFTLLMQVSIGLAMVLASPVIFYQVWGFLSPALTKREQRVIIPVLIGAAVLFLAGVAMADLVFLPVTMKLIEGIQTTAFESMISASDYYGFVIMISLAFGITFELPILILALTALGLITPKLLVKYRRHAIVATLIICEIITPGDLIISTLMLWIPVYGLYEVSIVVSWFVYRARQKRQAAAAADGTIGVEASA